MSTLTVVIGLALALLPFVIGYVARSKGRSALAWSLLSVVLTPFGGLILLLTLPERDGGTTEGPNGLRMLSDSFAKIAFGDGTEALHGIGQDDPLSSDAREARIDQLIAERLNALKAAPEPSTTPIGATGGVRPTFGKRR